MGFLGNLIGRGGNHGAGKEAVPGRKSEGKRSVKNLFVPLLNNEAKMLSGDGLSAKVLERGESDAMLEITFITDNGLVRGVKVERDTFSSKPGQIRGLVTYTKKEGNQWGDVWRLKEEYEKLKKDNDGELPTTEQLVQLAIEYAEPVNRDSRFNGYTEVKTEPVQDQR